MNVQRGGSADGLKPLRLRQAMGVGLLVGWTTAAAAAMDPRPGQRPVGACWIALTVTSGLLGLLVGGAGGLVAGASAGAGGFFLMTMLLGLAIESLLFKRADRVWLITSDLGRACAKVNVTGSGDWDLTSVAAWPFKRDVGTYLVREICQDADNANRVIVLKAQNDRVARLYTRHQFVDDGERDHRAMRRLPEPPGLQPDREQEEMNLG